MYNSISVLTYDVRVSVTFAIPFTIWVLSPTLVTARAFYLSDTLDPQPK